MSGLFKWGGRKDDGPSAKPAAVEAAAEAVSTSKVLPKVLAALSHVPNPTLMDLGPVVGANISFFGEHLACKILVEDIYATVEMHARDGKREVLPAALVSRLQRDPGSIDGILCWDIFDYLDKLSAVALSAHLAKLVRPGGVVYGFFGQTAAELVHYTRFSVEKPDTLRLRLVPATPTKRHVYVNRDIIKMFEGLVVTESVLLKSNARETMFRKPS